MRPHRPGRRTGSVNAHRHAKPAADLHCVRAAPIIQHQSHDTSARSLRCDISGEEAGSDRRAHHVPVELLLGEPEGQSAAPTPGHGRHAVGVHRPGRKAHQSTTAGLNSSLQTRMRAKKSNIHHGVKKKKEINNQHISDHQSDSLLLFWRLA